MTRFCYQESVNKGVPMPCTQEIFESLHQSDNVRRCCQQIAALNPQAADYGDQKNAIKKRLPIIIPHALSFANGRRRSDEATPSGLVMLDVDHIDNPSNVYTLQVEPVLQEQNIYFAAVTPSGHGLRLIAERKIAETIEAAMMRISEACGFEQIDAVTKDLARASYIMPWQNILYYQPDGLFCFPNEAAEAYWKACGTQEVEEYDEAYSEPQPTYPEGEEKMANNQQPTPLAKTYKDVPYATIVEQLMLLIGSDGGAAQGERNTVFFSLANYMRYICDFNADLLFAILPSFGLSEQERRQAIHSALGRPRKTIMPTVVQSAITMAQQQNIQAEVNDLKGGAADLELPRLPRLLNLVCRRIPEPYQPAMIIAALPVLGTLATRIRFNYLDGQVHSLSFFSCITAPAASGKSFIRKPIDLLLTPINEQDEIEREKEQSYKEKLRASKNAKSQPEDPRACPRNNGVNISVAKLLQLLTYSDGKHLIGISEEVDSLLKSEKAGVWSQKNDIYRLGFDNAEYGQAYMSDNSFSARVRVYYNMLLTGTPRSMTRFFDSNNIENGLMTRTCFAQLPDTSFSEMPVFEQYADKEREEIIRWARMLDREEGTIRCIVVDKAISEWLEEKRQRAIDADSHAADTLRRRAAVIGYRAGMLCYILEGRTLKKSIGDFATWVAEYVFRNQMEMFGDKLEQELTACIDASSGRGEATALLDLLPHEFTNKDLISIRAKRGQSVKANAIHTILSRWKQAGRIEKRGDGQWKKLAGLH